MYCEIVWTHRNAYLYNATTYKGFRREFSPGYIYISLLWTEHLSVEIMSTNITELADRTPFLSKQLQFEQQHKIFLVHIRTCLVTIHDGLRLFLIGWFNWVMARLCHIFGMFNNPYNHNEWEGNSRKLYFTY